jgi:deferrochelatase/peroxidase EfeB
VTAVQGYAGYVKQNTAGALQGHAWLRPDRLRRVHHRFGLAARKPSALADLPPLPNENLDPDYTGGDLCVQACADNPLVAFHAVRNLARIGMGGVANHWMELGFGRTSTTSTAQATPRNLLGFKDGTRNIKAEQTDLLNQHVWVGQETDQPWLRGGSYLVSSGRWRATR